MSSASGDAIRLQESSLDGITLIDVSLQHADVTLEGDHSLENQIKTLTDSESNTVSLIRDGSTLRIQQTDGARKSKPVTVLLPESDLPPFQCSIRRGSATFKQINAKVAFNGNRGNLHVAGGAGPLTASVSRGDVSIADRSGALTVNCSSGDLRFDSCSGPLAINSSSGDVFMSGCSSVAAINAISGDIVISRPLAQQIDASLKKGDVLIKDGSVAGASVKSVKGDVVVKSRLLLPSQRLAVVVDADSDEFDWDDDLDRDIPGSGISIAGDLEIEAGGEGLRIRKGGQEIVRAGADGLRIAHGSHGEISMGAEGIKVGSASTSDNSGRFTFITRKGDVILMIPDDVAARVEVLSNRGDVSSDIALVEVGRPGPKGTTRRFVGATDTADGERLLVRAKTDSGDISIKKGSMAMGTTGREDTGSREEHIRSVLTALANGEISSEEAQTLIAVIERGY